MHRALRGVEDRNPLFWVVAGSVCVALLGLIDFWTGLEISFSLFYLAPIGVVAWFGGRRLGGLLSMLSALSWLLAELAGGRKFSHPAIYVWNTLVRLGFFLIVTHLTAELRRSQAAHRADARTDFVSGAMNARYFNELLDMEIERSRRYRTPFTLACIDLDNFKGINNALGHQAGDEALGFVAAELKRLLRSTDMVARLGGDEFAVLMPATGEAEAEVAIAKLHAELTRRMREKGWPVTFSMGVVTCMTPPRSADDLVRAADELMYEVKNTTRNDVRFANYASPSPGAGIGS